MIERDYSVGEEDMAMLEFAQYQVNEVVRVFVVPAELLVERETTIYSSRGPCRPHNI